MKNNTKNNYYCLILPNDKVKLEAVEEIFREQEAYDKKLEISSIRSGYIFNKDNIKNLPKKLFDSLISSNFFKNLKIEKLDSIYIRNLLIKDFTILVSTNSEFITWVTLKLVEIENLQNLDKNRTVNFDGYLTQVSI